MKIACAALLVITLAANLSLAEETSIRTVKVPTLQGREIPAVLTFRDTAKALEVRPVKRAAVTIPYAAVSEYSYEFTRKHRIGLGLMLLVLPPIGLAVMCTHSTRYWLQIDYREQEIPRTYVLRMQKRDYLHVLDEVTRHTGEEVEILGNANKRR